ncbi:MAG TPA: hypothetical protein VF695_08415 [Sphingomonas sp.]
MRSVSALVITVALFAAGVLLFSLGLYQARLRYRRAGLAGDLRATGDVLIGSGVAAGAAYHLSVLISE